LKISYFIQIQIQTIAASQVDTTLLNEESPNENGTDVTQQQQHVTTILHENAATLA
jgi:hypothetical protein